MTVQPDSGTRWRLDRSVSISIIIGLIFNACVGIWYAARLDQRVATLEAWTKDNSGIERRLSVLETKIELLTDRDSRKRVER